MVLPQVLKTSDWISKRFTTRKGEEVEYRNVWSKNLSKEMKIVMEAASKYPYVAMVRPLIFSVICLW